MINQRAITQGELDQGVLERVVYTCTVPATWGTPVTATFTAYDITTGDPVNVSQAILAGAGTAVGSEITTPAVHSLTLNHKYELHCTFTTATSTLDFIIPIKATR
jgi:hypothetical protein